MIARMTWMLVLFAQVSCSIHIYCNGAYVINLSWQTSMNVLMIHVTRMLPAQTLLGHLTVHVTLVLMAVVLNA